MKLSRSKAVYTIVYGIAKRFEKEVKELISIASNIVLGFDEFLNKISQKNQTDICVQFWDKAKVFTRYLISIFLDKVSALDLLHALKSNVSTDILAKVIQISMDRM